MKQKFVRNIKIDVETLKSRLLKSNEFKKEETPSYGGQLYNTAVINVVHIKQIDDKTVEFSENGGYGGTLEVIATCGIQKIDNNSSRLILYFKYGNFEIDLLRKILIGLLITTALTLIIEPVVGFFFLFLTLINLTIMFNKRTIINSFLKRISSSLDIENDWMKN